MTRQTRIAGSLALLLAAGSGSAAWAQGPSKFDGEYAGTLTLDGVTSGDCTQPPLGARYPLSISGGEVHCAYVPRFDTDLTGRVDASGRFTAAARVKSGVIRMTGQVAGSAVTALIVSPSCRYSFHTTN